MKDYEALRGIRELNMHLSNPDLLDGEWGIPLVRNDQYIPEKLKGFNHFNERREDDEVSCIHFYINDIQFQRVWVSPEKYINALKRHGGMFTPDWSLYIDMPRPLKLYNTYRNRLIGQIMQREGIKVIPTISWGGEDTYDFCFDGIEERATVTISSIGIMGRKRETELWIAGVEELIARKNPSLILLFGTEVSYDFGNTKVIIFPNSQIEKFKTLRTDKKGQKREVSPSRVIKR